MAALIATGGVSSGAALPGTPVAFSSIPGFADDDHAAALATFRITCHALDGSKTPPRSAQSAPITLKEACTAALDLRPSVDEGRALRFFETYFTPCRLEGGFLTGYYEPVVEGSLTPTAAFATPLLARPPDLVSGVPGRPLPGLDASLSAGRRNADGSISPYPDRAAIEAGALGALAPPLVYVRDPAEAFFIQVQGSARIALPDGTTRRLVYAGRNGQPYTSIGRVLVDTLHIPPSDMGLAQLKAWIRANGQRPGEAGAALMARNRSYIFFAFDASLKPDAGPIGGAGVSLTPLRSLAIDRTMWPYGLPVFIDAVLPWRSEALTPFRRLMVAQDTGSAIIGAARGDIFFGSGADAADRAGPIRHSGTFYVLWPKDRATERSAP